MPWLVSHVYVPELVPIAALLRELLDDIVSLLGPSEWKALRLTCRIPEDCAVRFLFQRVRLSCLMPHLRAFCQIGESRRLSPLPRQLIWYEANYNGLADETRVQESFKCLDAPPTRDQESDEEVRKLCRELSSYLSCNLWITWDGSVDSATDAATIPQLRRTFQQYLSPAFNSMPNIDTFISRPLPDDLVLPGASYDFVAGSMPNLHPRSVNQGLILMLCLSERQFYHQNQDFVLH